MVDVSANRSAQKWTRSEQAGRVLWGCASVLFRLTPRPLWGLRRAVLRAFGAQVGSDVHIYPSVRITIPWNLTIGQGAAVGDRVILYALGPISVGAGATVSQGAHLCAGSHDWRDPAMTLQKLPILVGEGAWVCADAFIGPNVTVGAAAIVSARAVVMRDVAPGAIVAGNPASQIGTRDSGVQPPATGQ